MNSIDELYQIVSARKGLHAFLRLQACRETLGEEYVTSLHVAETVRCIAPQSERVTARPRGAR